MAEANSSFPTTIIKPNPWVSCIAVFIDVVGSSELDGAGGQEQAALVVAKKLQDCVKTVWEIEKATPPNTARLFGDGMFCVWEVEVGENDTSASVLKEEVLRSLLSVLNAAQQQGIGPLKIGGTFGRALKAQIVMADGKEIDDYFGPTINLASKIEGLARPSGLLIDEEFYKGINASDFSLRSTRFEDPRKGKRDQPKSYVNLWKTATVDDQLSWTCLAWPGFADPDMEWSLHKKGITVLTHEGLRGKIDSLKIWPRGGECDGDSFEVLIDDFDGIHYLNSGIKERINFYQPTKNSTKSRSIIVDELQKRISDQDHFKGEGTFFFTPIRCGLNAIAYNETAGDFLKSKRSYAEILNDSCDDDGISLGLYENPWASLCVIADAYFRQIDRKDTPASIYTTMDEENWRAATGWLLYLQKRFQRRGDSTSRLFRLFSEIRTSSLALQENRVNIFIGGGAWLGNSKYRVNYPKKIKSMVPQGSRGYIWVEGATVLSEAISSKSWNIGQFEEDFDKTLLDEGYQDGLTIGLEYGATPVRESSIRKLLTDEGVARLFGSELDDLEDGPRATVDETRLIYNVENGRIYISDNCRLRRRPRKDHLRHWLDAWELIREKLCDQ
jgi:class 3 adenylate cyclase